ncbi:MULTISPECIES: hypothetical protein [Streptomyces]|nr:hypothetical protein [Streptomyces sp. TSRI0281]
MSGFASLKAMRREHHILVHGLFTYLSVTWFLVVVLAASLVQG